MVGFPNNPWGFPTKNDHFGGVKWGYHHLRKHLYDLGVSPGPHDASEINNLFILMKGLRNKPSRTPLLVRRGGAPKI